MRPRRGSVSPVPRNLFVTMAPAASEGCYGRGRGRMTDVLGEYTTRGITGKVGDRWVSFTIGSN
jgi:hypothetical protein